MQNTVKLILAATAVAALGACSVNTAPPAATPSPVVVAPQPSSSVNEEIPSPAPLAPAPPAKGGGKERGKERKEHA